jgi:hypothetical protein
MVSQRGLFLLCGKLPVAVAPGRLVPDERARFLYAGMQGVLLYENLFCLEPGPDFLGKVFSNFT